MHLNLSTDYALRVLIYLATCPERFVPASEISQAFEVSDHHLSKVAKSLTARGWLEGRRGSGGGVRLAVDPQQLKLGQVVRDLEGMHLVECFSKETDSCRISSSCKLKHALRAASAAFVKTLDGFTLADLTQGRRLRTLLGVEG